MSGTSRLTGSIKIWRILPRFAWKGVVKNGTVYYPYIGAGIFSVFTYFVFSSILHNDIINILPKSGYAWMLLQIGRVLLGMILLPFLFYTNSFLIKKRKREIGLYSILGLEKTHIGMILFAESVFTYAVVTVAGIISGTVLSKLLFLLLLRMTGLPVDASFDFSPSAFAETAIYFLWVYAFNLIYNLIQLGKSRPVELLSGGKKGEKEPRFLWIYAVLGIAVLVWGYVVAVRSKLDSMIFINFFLAVFLVVLGTYFVFTSGSIVFLKILKKKKGIYYKASNFITISGMLYRMKKNAASLVNICIFSTMVIITLICTSSLYIGLSGMLDFNFPFDGDVYFRESQMEKGTVDQKMEELAGEYGVELHDSLSYERIALSCAKDEDTFGVFYADRMHVSDNYKVNLLLLDDYNRIEGRTLVLEDKEALIFSSGADFGYDKVDFMGKELVIKEEPEKMRIESKSEKNTFMGEYYLVVKDKKVRDELAGAWAEENGVEDIEGFVRNGDWILCFCVDGEETERENYVKAFKEWCQTQPGCLKFDDNLDTRSEWKSMYGGLLFIGVLFSPVFMMCLLLIMYYKQIAEGYEDQSGFAVMQKVGMSDREIKETIHRQVLTVFFLPVIGALMHTAAGLFMVDKLFAALRFFDTGLILKCTVGVTVIFIVFYGFSYVMTARTYYRIVSRGEQ